jgi:hypothetical protein
MARAGVYLAAAAIAAALVLASGGGGIAAADTTGDSAGSDNTTKTANTTDSSAASGNAAASEHSVEPNTFSGSDNEKAASDPAPDPVDSSAGSAKDPTPTGSSEAPVEKKPVDKDPGTHDNPGDKSISRVPLRPEAPPPLDLIPLPQAPAPADLAPLPAAPLAPAPEAPPPADLPPPIPAAPVDPDTVDAIDGEARHRPGGNEPPVLTVPIVIARAPIPPTQLLGASIATRWTSSGSAVEPTPRWSGGSSPRLLRASSDQLLLPEPWLKSFGSTAREQLAYRSGYGEYSARSLARTAAGALPGLAGLMMMTACGVCLGYRQANMAQQLRADGFDRFL